jgi:heat shock protein HslJ
MDQETAYLAALQTAVAYIIQGNELVLKNAGGTNAAVFKARTSTSALPGELLADAQ